MIIKLRKKEKTIKVVKIRIINNKIKITRINQIKTKNNLNLKLKINKIKIIIKIKSKTKKLMTNNR